MNGDGVDDGSTWFLLGTGRFFWGLMALLTVLFPTFGCFSLTGQVDVATRERTEVIDTREVKAELPERNSIRSSVEVKLDTVEIDVRQIGWCKESVMELSRTTVVEERDLPGTHWIVFGSSLALLGGGGAMIGIGAAGISDAESFDVGTPAEEEAYDRNRILLPVGIGVAALGSVLLGSEIADMVMAGDVEQDPVEKEKEIASETVECLTEPMAGMSLTLETEQGVAYVTTKQDGRRVLRFDEEPLQTLSEGASTLTVTCAECDPSTVSLVDQSQ